VTSPGRSAPAVEPSSRRALAAGSIGNAVEWYDYAIYGALGTVLVPVFFPANDYVLLSAFALYGTAFLVRPVGAVFFGRRADLRGRQWVLVTVVALMTGATAVVGVLPGFAAIGIAAPVLLVLLRVGQGLAAGGELGVAAVFLVEHASPGRRGVFGACHTASLSLGLAAGLLVAGAVVRLPDDVLAGEGWRAAFLLALPLGLVGVYLRRRVTETPGFVRLEQTEAVVAATVRVLWAEHRGGLTAGFAVIAFGSLTFNVFFVFLPNHLAQTTSLALSTTLLTAVAGLFAAAAAAVLLGRLSDRVGRRPVVLGSMAALVVSALPLTMAAHSGSLLALTLAEIAVGSAIGGVLSASMLVEMFPAELRATGLGLTAGLATALVGGAGPLVSQALFLATGSTAAPAVYVTAVGCLALLLTRSWPETAFHPIDR
jgi:MFS transporter, MHS family, proline/betaine transporter